MQLITKIDHKREYQSYRDKLQIIERASIREFNGYVDCILCFASGRSFITGYVCTLCKGQCDLSERDFYSYVTVVTYACDRCRDDGSIQTLNKVRGYPFLGPSRCPVCNSSSIWQFPFK